MKLTFLLESIEHAVLSHHLKKSKTYARASKLELLSSLDEHYNFNNVIKT